MAQRVCLSHSVVKALEVGWKNVHVTFSGVSNQLLKNFVYFGLRTEGNSHSIDTYSLIGALRCVRPGSLPILD